MKVYTSIFFYALAQLADRIIWPIGLARKYIGILSHDFLNILYGDDKECGKWMLKHFRNLSLLDLPIWELRRGKFEGGNFRGLGHMTGHMEGGFGKKDRHMRGARS